jgi:hypothetical protein
MKKKEIVIVVRSPFVEITGGSTIKAILLNQFLVWTSRHFKSLEEWRKDGWVWKSGQKLREDSLLDISVATALKEAKELVKMGFLDIKHNRYKDNRYEYRLLLGVLYEKLKGSGYDPTKVIKNSEGTPFSIWFQFLEKLEVSDIKPILSAPSFPTND